MKIRFIDYPLMDRLAEIRDKLDGSKREVLLPEDAWILRNIKSKKEGPKIALVATKIAVNEIVDIENISIENPFVRAMLICLGQPDAPTSRDLVKHFARSNEILEKLVEISHTNTREWNIDNFEWQLVQGLQLGWPDQMVDSEAPVHRVTLKYGYKVLGALIELETVRAWGYL